MTPIPGDRLGTLAQEHVISTLQQGLKHTTNLLFREHAHKTTALQTIFGSDIACKTTSNESSSFNRIIHKQRMRWQLKNENMHKTGVEHNLTNKNSCTTEKSNQNYLVVFECN